MSPCPLISAFWMPTSGSLKGSFADVTGLTEHRGCKFSSAFGWHPFEVDKLLGVLLIG